jgi:hypothetical protein
MNPLNVFARQVVERSLLLAARSSRIRDILDNQTLDRLALNPGRLAGRSWDLLDAVYSQSRRELDCSEGWRFGPKRIHEVTWEGYEALGKYGSIVGKVYCDLGCGVSHPYGISTALFLNGAEKTIAVDRGNCKDQQRAAEALADLLYECVVHPENWHWSEITRAEFLKRIAEYDLKALRKGDLQTGLRHVPSSHHVMDICEPFLPETSVDLLTSRAVLEHFLNFELAMSKLFQLMGPGGMAYHHIDLADHRIYLEPGKYHSLSFLAEDDDWSDGLVNRLRSCELKTIFENTGFDILQWNVIRAEMPAGFSSQIKGRFRAMPVDELNIKTVCCVLRKPLVHC